MHKTVPFTSQYCFSLFSQSTGFYCHIRLYRHHMICLLSFIVKCSSCGNSNPGHGTKFVTLPSSILLFEFYVKAGSMCLKICYCNHYLMWLVLLLLCGHK